MKSPLFLAAAVLAGTTAAQSTAVYVSAGGVNTTFTLPAFTSAAPSVPGFTSATAGGGAGTTVTTASAPGITTTATASVVVPYNTTSTPPPVTAGAESLRVAAEGPIVGLVLFCGLGLLML